MVGSLRRTVTWVVLVGPTRGLVTFSTNLDTVCPRYTDMAPALPSPRMMVSGSTNVPRRPHSTTSCHRSRTGVPCCSMRAFAWKGNWVRQ